jgi:hypothetical protein
MSLQSTDAGQDQARSLSLIPESVGLGKRAGIRIDAQSKKPASGVSQDAELALARGQ